MLNADEDAKKLDFVYISLSTWTCSHTAFWHPLFLLKSQLLILWGCCISHTWRSWSFLIFGLLFYNKLGTFQPFFFLWIFLLSLFWYSHYPCVEAFKSVSHFSEALLIFFIPFTVFFSLTNSLVPVSIYYCVPLREFFFKYLLYFLIKEFPFWSFYNFYLFIDFSTSVWQDHHTLHRHSYIPSIQWIYL